MRFSMSSADSNVPANSAGTKSDSLYSLTLIGLLMSRRAYSAVFVLSKRQVLCD